MAERKGRKFRLLLSNSSGNVSELSNGGSSFWEQFTLFEVITESILIPIIVLANTLILIIIKRMGYKRKPGDVLVAGLAVSDLLIGLVVLPLDIARYLETEVIANLSISFCYFEYSVYLQPLCWSVQNMFLIALECFASLFTPFWHRIHVTTNLAFTTVVVSWIIGAAFFILPYFLLPVGLRRASCATAEKRDTSFITIYPNIIFFATIVLQIFILIKSIKNRAVLKRQVDESLVKRKLKLIVFTMFVIFWGPIFIGVLLKELNLINIKFKLIMRILLTIAHFNSFLNCVVYIVKSGRFRQEIKRLVLKCKRRNRIGNAPRQPVDLAISKVQETISSHVNSTDIV